jgi:O-methyltransferase
MHLAKRAIRSAFRRVGFDLSRIKEKRVEELFPSDFDEATQELCRFVRPYTMTSPERICVLRQALMHVVQHEIPGDIVECGVWKGGSMMAAARTLQELGAIERNLHLFDTFDGMPEPGEKDVCFSGESAAELMSRSDQKSSLVWAYSAFEEVNRNLLSTGYPAERISFVKGKVEETIPTSAPAQIALLRLDTDWYESTYHELVHLYPRLSSGGVLIIDDYGYWKGARRAVDTYISEQKLDIFLHRIDDTARICIKKCCAPQG